MGFFNFLLWWCECWIFFEILSILCYWFSVASLCFFSIGPSWFELGNILSVVSLGSLREVVLFGSVSSLLSFVSIICFMFPELEVSELFLDPGLSSGCIFSLVCKFYSFVSFVHSLYFVSLVENRLLKSFWDFVPLGLDEFQHLCLINLMIIHVDERYFRVQLVR